MVIRFLTSGESHGECLSVIIEGFPSGIFIDENFVNEELEKRQQGIGRGERMQIEKDKIKIKSGVRFNISTGAPICVEIKNKDFENRGKELLSKEKITKIRPGHADFAGAVKYNQQDIRNIFERSSARETATRVVVGAFCKLFLKEFKIKGYSYVLNIKGTDFQDKEATQTLIKKAAQNGDSLGGQFKIIFKNIPIGLGSCMHWDRRIDGLISQAVMSIPAIKAVEIGLGVESANVSGVKMHDEIFNENNKIIRKTNNAGGIEGGMTNGEDIIIKGTMKPIPSLKTPLNSIDLLTKENIKAHYERSDVCAIEACTIIAENMVAYVICNAFLEKFSCDNLKEIKKFFEIRDKA